jgi:hypothetical protein
MSKGEPSFEEMFRRIVKSVQSDEHGPLLARVETYDQDSQRATAQPLLMIYNHGELVLIDVQQDIPVKWPGGGDGSLTFPVAAGDVGVVTPMEADISGWSASGSINQGAPTQRKLSLSDVVLDLRVTSRASPLPSTAYAAGATVLRGSDVRLGDSTADKLVALADLVRTELDGIKADLDLLSNHTHGEVETGTDVTGTGPPLTYSPSTPAATKVKAK